MSPETWVVAGGVVVSLMALLITFLGYRENHGSQVSKVNEDRIRQIVREELSPVTLVHTQITERLSSLTNEQHQASTDIREVSGKIGTVLDRVTVLETKIEVFWKSVAMDAAKIIHSPDPRRAHIDALLESFMSGTMTPGEEEELRGILAVIRDYEPGISHLTFPVYPGEQIAAAILLRTMSHAVPAQKGGGGK